MHTQGVWVGWPAAGSHRYEHMMCCLLNLTDDLVIGIFGTNTLLFQVIKTSTLCLGPEEAKIVAKH